MIACSLWIVSGTTLIQLDRRYQLVAVDDDGVITLTVGTVSLKTGVGLRIFETLAIDDDG